MRVRQQHELASYIIMRPYVHVQSESEGGCACWCGPAFEALKADLRRTSMGERVTWSNVMNMSTSDGHTFG
jgi:hypothetical protein